MSRVYLTFYKNNEVVDEIDITPTNGKRISLSFIKSYFNLVFLFQLMFIILKAIGIFRISWGYTFLPLFTGILLFLCATSLFGIMFIFLWNEYIDVMEKIEKE